MKKQYIQPSMEVNAVEALQNMLSESTPFDNGGGTGSSTPIMAPNRPSISGEIF